MDDSYLQKHKDWVEKLHPGNILHITDLSDIPRNDNPVG